MKTLLMTSKASQGFNIAPPLGLYRLKSYLEAHGFACDIFDYSIDDQAMFLERAAAGEYAIIGMSVSHSNMIDDINLINQFRERCAGRECLFVAGGQEATYNYAQWLDLIVDVVVLGYGEKPLLELARAFAAGKLTLRSIPGVAYATAAGPVLNPAPPITQEEFDRLTYERVLDMQVPFDRYWNYIRENLEALNFSTSRFIPELVRIYSSSHCPNHCGYCSSHNFLSFSQGCKARIFDLSAEKVLALMRHFMSAYGAKGFLFSDDEFLANKGRAREFLRLVTQGLASGELDAGLTLNCQARVTDFLRQQDGKRVVDEAFIALLVKAGFHSLGLGVESFKRELLQATSMNKHGYGQEEALRVIETMLRHGLAPQVNIILFIPESSPEDVVHSMTLAMRVIVQGAQIAVTPRLYAIPGAPLYDNPNYPVEYLEHQAGDRTIRISHYFRPWDDLVAQAAAAIDQAQAEEIEAFKAASGWNHKVLPKTAMGILTFVAAAKLLKRPDLAGQWLADLDRLVARKHLEAPITH